MKADRLAWVLLTILLPFIPLLSSAQQEQMASILGLDEKWHKLSVAEIEKAAGKGDANAQVNLGMLLEMGKDAFFSTPGNEKLDTDPEKAAFWYRKAAEQGDMVGQNNLAIMLYYGRGTKTNQDEAIKWLTAAAEQGETTAQANLALYFMRIEFGGVAYPRYEDADKWYLKAAEGGDWYSQFDIGRAYESGLGVVRDRVQALKWYYLSASHGSERAKLAADKLESELTRDQVSEAELEAKSFIPRKKETGDSQNSDTSFAKRLPTASGSAFFITEDGYLITNYHVINNASQIFLITSNVFASGQKNLAGNFPVAFADLIPGVFVARVVKVDAANDLALLKAVGRFSPLPIASSRTVKLGGTVATVGFPDIGLQGFAPKLAKGEIASLSGAADDPRYFQTSLPVQPGNSGGALVDAHGNVVGIVAAKLDASAALEASGALPENVNYAVKSSLLLSFLESVPDVANELKEPNAKDEPFEDVVKSAQDAAVLVLVY